MNRNYVLIVVLSGMFLPNHAWAKDEPDVKVATSRSVVQIETTLQRMSPSEPWKMGSTEVVTGTGVIIDVGGPHILTCAHLVAYANQIDIRLHQSKARFSATVVATAPGVDLALLSVNDPSILSQYPMLPLAEEMTNGGDKLRVYGYPMGSDLSETEGVVSLIEYNKFYFDTFGVRIKLDMKLNPDNIGGPAVADGHIVGIAYFGDQDHEVAYLISAWEINLFLRDISDGNYDGKPILVERVQRLNSAFRARLGIGADVAGVTVGQLVKSHLDTPLQQWDVVTQIGNQSIDNRGTVYVRDGLPLYFEYVLPYLVKDNKVEFGVLRGGERLTIAVPVSTERSRVVPWLKNQNQDYAVLGPLVFTTPTQEVVSRMIKNQDYLDYLMLKKSHLISRLFDQSGFKGETLVVVSTAFSNHPICQGYSNPSLSVVSQVNGQDVRNLRHLIELVRDAEGEFLEFSFHDLSERLVFRREEFNQATNDILESENIPHQFSKDLRNVWID